MECPTRGLFAGLRAGMSALLSLAWRNRQNEAKMLKPTPRLSGICAVIDVGRLRVEAAFCLETRISIEAAPRNQMGWSLTCGAPG